MSKPIEPVASYPLDAYDELTLLDSRLAEWFIYACELADHGAEDQAVLIALRNEERPLIITADAYAVIYGTIGKPITP